MRWAPAMASRTAPRGVGDDEFFAFDHGLPGYPRERDRVVTGCRNAFAGSSWLKTGRFPCSGHPRLPTKSAEEAEKLWLTRFRFRSKRLGRRFQSRGKIRIVLPQFLANVLRLFLGSVSDNDWGIRRFSEKVNHRLSVVWVERISDHSNLVGFLDERLRIPLLSRLSPNRSDVIVKQKRCTARTSTILLEGKGN